MQRSQLVEVSVEVVADPVLVVLDGGRCRQLRAYGAFRLEADLQGRPLAIDGEFEGEGLITQPLAIRGESREPKIEIQAVPPEVPVGSNRERHTSRGVSIEGEPVE